MPMELYLMLHLRMSFLHILQYSIIALINKNSKNILFNSKTGFSTVWASLENGAKQIGNSVSSETVMTVKYK